MPDKELNHGGKAVSSGGTNVSTYLKSYSPSSLGQSVNLSFDFLCLVRVL